LPTPWPASTWSSAVIRRQPAAAIGCFYAHSLPRRLRSASHLHHINVIIAIVIVHSLLKWNVYLSLYVILYVSTSAIITVIVDFGLLLHFHLAKVYVIIIVIVIVHPLFKRNSYFSLMCNFFFPSSFLEIIFLFLF
jgi:membrane-associated HD superfamily phosphohydrolase